MDGINPHLPSAIGGVTVLGRGTLAAWQAYRRNHAEISQALAAGIVLREDLEPIKFEQDHQGGVTAVLCRDGAGVAQSIPARTVLVAIGTEIDVVESAVSADDGRHYRLHTLDLAGNLHAAPPPAHAKAESMGFFTSYRRDARYVSVLGDAHPAYYGNVVRALASAQRAYPEILRALALLPTPHAAAHTAHFIDTVSARLTTPS